MRFHSYIKTFTLHWQNSLSYPLSFAMWRIRQFLTTLTALTVWSILFDTSRVIYGFERADITSYIFLASLLQSLILATSLNGLAEDIYNGNISNLFVKPIKPLFYLLAKEGADKMLNLVCTVFETFVLILIFHPQLYAPSLPTLLVFAASVIGGIVLLLLIVLLFGCIGFWSSETWGPRFLFFMFIEFTAGKLFPLNMFPQWLQQVMAMTPFPYLTYFQTQVFLEHFSPAQLINSFLIMIAWIMGLTLLYRKTWDYGLKEYGALGR